MLRWLRWWRPPYLLRSVIVNLRHDETTAISGVLWASRGPWLILRSASLLQAQQPPAALDGEVIIDRANVAFVQVVP